MMSVEKNEMAERGVRGGRRGQKGVEAGEGKRPEKAAPRYVPPNLKRKMSMFLVASFPARSCPRG